MITTSILLYTFAATGLVIVFSYRLHRRLKQFTIRHPYTAAVDAPSVSICIPARNETHAMTQCLERVLASDYRKMEVIVYDDGSADDTSVLIRSFAHAGVRFVPGDQLPESWLGKNHALEVLAREASGTYIVFMDVDTFITPTTISQLVGYAMTERVDMVSVIPGRMDGWRPSVIFGHLRYFWELLLSRRHGPASSSSIWMINRSVLLNEYGGFAAIKASVAPEASLAATLTTHRYHCLVDGKIMGVSYEKKWTSQLETSRRLLYPMVGGRPILALGAFLVLVLLNMPTVLLLSAFVYGLGLWQLVGVWFVIAHMGIYASYTSRLWRRGWWIGGVLWPVVVLQELILFISSCVGYARHSITWKGRPVSARSARVRAISIDR